MNCGENDGCRERDLVAGRPALLLWCLPTALVIVGVVWPSARAALWIPALLLMGIACVVNARRCGRLHCHITGPLFLLAGLATALDAGGVVRLGWVPILVATAAGTAVAFGLEWLRGRYVPARRHSEP